MIKKYETQDQVIAWQDQQWTTRQRKQLSAIASRLMEKQRLFTLSNHMTILGCCYDDFRWHLERQLKNCKIMDQSVTWKSGEWVVDHIIPVCSFDPISRESLRECWHWTNLRPMTRRENLRKRCKILHTWHVPFSVRQQWIVRETFIGEDGLTHSKQEPNP